MILLFYFLSLFIGINIRFSIILGIIEIIALLVFVFFRFGKKPALISLFVSLLGVGLSFFRLNFNKETYISVVVESKSNYFIASSTFEKFYIYQKDNQYEIGDILSIKGYKTELEFTTLESDFDFKEYLNNKGVYSQLNVTKIEVKFSTPFKIQKIKRDFLNHLNKDSQALVGAMLFSMGSDEDIYSTGKELHLFRLLSNSGIYLFLLYRILLLITGYIVKKDKEKKIVTLSLFIPILIFSFPRFVVLKFFLFKIFQWINEYPLKKKFSYLELLSIAGIFFLLIDYHYALQDAFILSFFIPIESYLFNNSFKRVKKWKKKILVTLLILTSFIPFSLSYYQEIAPLSYLFQILLTPVFVIYYFLSLIAFVHIPIYRGIDTYTLFIKNTFNSLEKINIAIYGMEMTGGLIVLYEAIYLFLVYFLAIRHIPIIKVGVTLLSLNLLIYFIPIKSFFKDMVSFINVGQGDSTLIRKKNTTILIDTGGLTYKDIARDCLIPYFKKNRIYDIDLLITTHDDFDHSGGVYSLMHNFKVKEYVTDYRKFPISVGGITLKNYNVYPELWNEENDESLVIGFNLNNYNYLITGDCPSKIEKQIIKDNSSIPCDILKVGHHGSKTSSSDAFIKYLKPKVGIISCGKNNKYGHPNSEVLAVLRKYHVKIRRTDLEGTITYWQ